MATQNRYYSNLAQGTFLTVGLALSDTTMQVQQTVKWPTQFPFAVRVEPGTFTEEVVLVTSGLGTAGQPFTITRGYDGTAAVIHSSGVSVIPGGVQADLAEPQQHLNLTGSASGAHGLPASAWGGGTVQLIQTQLASGGVGPLTFSGIPSTFNHLKVVFALRGNGSAGDIINGIDVMGVAAQGVGFTAGSNWQGYFHIQGSSIMTMDGTTSGGVPLCGGFWNTYYGTPGAGMGEIFFPFYSSSIYKTFKCDSVATDGGGAGCVFQVSGGWQSGGVITGIQLSPEGSSSGWAAGKALLYGIS